MDKVEIIIVGQDKYNLIQEGDRVKFIRTNYQANPAEAQNIGCQHAKGKVILFTDADCIADTNWIKKLMKHHKGCLHVVGGSVNINFKGANFWNLSDNIACFYFQLRDRKKGMLSDATLGTLNFSISKDVFFKVEKFDETPKLGQDVDLIARLKELGYGIYFEPNASVCHHTLRNSFKSLLNHAIRYGRFFTRLMEKHPGYFTKRNTLYTHSNRILLLISSPLKALVDTCSIFRRHEMLRKYWYTFGGVLLFRFFIYYSISKALRKKSKQTIKIN